MSTQTGIRYDLRVYLPAGYNQGSTAYPIIYLMDSETRFDASVNVVQTKGIDAIVVGVGNMGNSRRVVDFEMPGAGAYYNFHTLELIPFIESRYRADPRQRILNGHSLSGLFVMYALFMEPPGNRHYAAFLAEDGSLNEQPAILSAMEQEMLSNTARQLPVTLALSVDTHGNFASVPPMCAKLVNRGYIGLKMEMLVYMLGHVPMDVPAFGDSLQFILGINRTSRGEVTPCV